jgi:hypothetical protein
MQVSEFQLNDIVTVTELNAQEDAPVTFTGVVSKIFKKVISVSNDKGVSISVDPSDPFFKVSRKRGARP